MAYDPLVIIVVILSNWQKASVYFWLAVISGCLVFMSCIFGAFLSRRMSSTPPPIMTPYLSRNASRIGSRAPSLHALSYMTTGHQATGYMTAPHAHHTMNYKSPTHSSHSRHTLIDCSKKRGVSEETEESYPWIFVSTEDTKHLERKASYF
eukprot:TRINITY_DN10702_c0_g1_i1.p1 TRINITY_DN10702_c0_g1~~TRINITY_DN10702_c0_g1_i1.p1  ORF type:complete len:151 (+),score=4.25 TRINITY_DN10702_c0_g1_i1:97-549(+)